MTVERPQRVDRDGYIDILQREAIVLVPYPDDSRLKYQPIGPDTLHSQGVGNQTNYSVDPPRAVKADDLPITVEKAVEWLKKAVSSREPAINKALKVQVTQHQFNALHSIYYQFGTKALKRIAGLFNAGRPWAAMLAFSEFPFGQDEVQTEGHSKRRISEMAMGGFAYYDDQEKIPVYDGDPRATPRRYVSAADLEL